MILVMLMIRVGRRGGMMITREVMVLEDSEVSDELRRTKSDVKHFLSDSMNDSVSDKTSNVKITRTALSLYTIVSHDDNSHLPTK